LKKSLEISSKFVFDTSDIDKTVKIMQDKLAKLYAPSDAIRMQNQTQSRLSGLGLGIGAPSNPAAEQAMLRMRKDLNGYIKEEWSLQQSLGKVIAQKDEHLKTEMQRQKELVAGSKEQLRIKKEIANLESLQNQRKEAYAVRWQALQQSAQVKENINAFKASDYGDMGSDFAGAMDKFTGAKAKASAAAMARASSIMGAMGVAISAGGELYGNYAQSPVRTAGNLGAGIQGTVGQESQIVGNRRSAFESAFNPERSRAARMAIEANRGARVETGGNLIGNALGWAGTGAAAGSVFGPVGTAVGGIGGAAVGAYKAFSDPAQRSLALSPFSQRYGNEYESIMSKRLGEDYQKSVENLKNQNPGKTLASGYYEQNYMQNLQAQRSMGMGNAQFYGKGGFAEGGGQFTPEMMIQASQGILSAGGSTRGAAGNSLFSNQLQRGMDMTNAPQVLGSLSGGIGGAEGTRQATIKILAEGMKLGLDDSKFAEENRRFTQTAAEIVTRSGATSGGAVSQVAGGFSSFVGENTVAGIGAAKTAYEQYQKMTSETTGARGVMRAAGFLRSPTLNKMSTIDKQALLQVPENEVSTDNPMITGLARRYGIEPQDVVDAMKGVNQGTQSRFGASDKIRDKLRSRGIDVGRTSQPDYMKNLSKEDQGLVGQYLAFNVTEQGNLGIRENTARAGGYVGRNSLPVTDQTVEAKLATGKGRGEDVTVAETAKDFGVVLQNFRDFKKEIMPSADAISNFTGKVREMMIVLGRATEQEIPGIIKAYTQQKAATQAQSGKRSQ
jgi:hypothetical protein